MLDVEIWGCHRLPREVDNLVQNEDQDFNVHERRHGLGDNAMRRLFFEALSAVSTFALALLGIAVVSNLEGQT